MKLLLITAVKAFEDNVKLFLKEAEIHAYSYQDVSGFKNCSALAVKDNWFANDKSECESVLFHVFAEPAKIDIFIEKASSFNRELAIESAIHVVEIQTDKIL